MDKFDRIALENEELNTRHGSGTVSTQTEPTDPIADPLPDIPAAPQWTGSNWCECSDHPPSEITVAVDELQDLCCSDCGRVLIGTEDELVRLVQDITDRDLRRTAEKYFY